MNELLLRQFISELAKNPPSNKKDFERAKKNFQKSQKSPKALKSAEAKKIYLELIKAKKIKPNTQLEKLLLAKKIRSLSGVAVIAVLTKPYPCPGKCIYCPEEKAMPKSYLSNEPAVMRAMAMKFDPYRQVQTRLKALLLNGHPIDKIELIVMGGTFSYLPKKYQTTFVSECFRAVNDFPRKRSQPEKTYLEKEQKRNERSKNRIVGLTLETRPDYVDEKEIKNFRRLGATRVELGVQAIDDEILAINQRGHAASETIRATKLLRDSGFKICYHLMPGLLGSTFEKDLAMFQELFSSPSYQPDMVKIYPCVVTKESPLWKIWKQGGYSPYTNEQIARLICEIKKLIPPYVRINRLIRDIPAPSIVAGPNITNLRQKISEMGVRCQCIRCREARDAYDKEDDGIILSRINYSASEGKEIFLQFSSIDRQKLFALLRLRISDNMNSSPFPCLKGAAIVRELHTFGKTTSIDKKDSSSPQHKGLGKKLLLEAEKITAEEFGLDKIAVISGVGVREYYRKNGYRLCDTFMTKKIRKPCISI